MAITDAYATAANYRAVITKSDTAEDAEVLEDLTAISRYLDIELGRFFTQDAAAVARNYFPPAGSGKLLLTNDIASTTGLVVLADDDEDGTAETTVAATDYRLHPQNAELDPEAKPWRGLMLNNWGDVGSWVVGRLYEVTAIYGWPAVPQAIERATIHLAAILRLESPRATRRIAEGFNEAFESSDQAQNILADLKTKYKRVWI
jgi:hypothetical protein